jgi:hypothetical protein
MGVVLLDVDIGLVIGLAVSMLLVIIKDQVMFRLRSLTVYQRSKEASPIFVDQALIRINNSETV